jgi:hypothetical protein
MPIRTLKKRATLERSRAELPVRSRQESGRLDPFPSSADGANQFSAASQAALGYVFEVVGEWRRLDRNELERLSAAGTWNDH